MPIPQLSKKVRTEKSWAQNKKKHHILTNRTSHKGGFSRPRKAGLLLAWLPQISKEKIKKYAILSVVFLMVFSFLFVAWISRGLPDPNRLMDREIAQSTKIYDRTGETILYEIHGDEKRTLVKLEDIPDYLKWATISIEDKDYYKHGGFSVWAIFRTAVTNVLFGKKAGGSTLTQQFVKNSVLTTEKTYTRKIKELILAYRLEKKFSKDEILQMYFNEIPYGSTAYGVEAASQRYFGKSVKDINIAEAAVLAALPQAPSRYSPYGSNRDLLIERQHYILDLMVKYGYIEKEKAMVAKELEIKFKEQSNNILAPHFVMYVKEQLSEKYGEKMVEQGGLKIYTTLDLYKQKIAEEVITEKTKDNEEKYQASNAALVSIDPKNGQILTMVGSRDYFNEDIDGQVNIATSLRQPGSSMKPLVYAAAFAKGYTPDTVLYDVVTNFSNNPSEPYEPHNYNNKEQGPISMRKALAGSLNIPAVKTIYLAGIDNVLDIAKELGYTSLSDRNRFGLSLVLGGGEVELLEHANAFSAFAREGEVSPIMSVLKIEDKDGKVIEEFKETKKKKVLDANVARMVNDILSDNGARAYVFGERNYLTLGDRPVAAKTGTTNDYKDAWTMGYTPSIVTGVWVGNNSSKEMKRGADGSVVAAPIWHDYMQKILGNTPVEGFKKPEIPKTGKAVLDGQIGGDRKIKIDMASGLLATEYTPESFIEEKIYREDHCILYYVNKDDPKGDAPENPASDPQFELWEKSVQRWAAENNFSTSTPPTEYDNVHKPENRPTLNINTPTDRQTIIEPTLSSTVSVSAPKGVGRVEYYIDNNLIYTNTSYPFDLNKNIDFLNNGFHQLKARACDNVDNCSEKTIEININTNNKTTNTAIGISWVSPTNGLAVNPIDFPLNISFNVDNPKQIAKIILYYKDSAGNTQTASTFYPIESNTITGQWKKTPPTDTYTLWAEAYGWNGQHEKTGENTITINGLQ